MDDDGQPLVYPLIRKIKQRIATDPTLIPEYPPPLGMPEFSSRASQLALGRDSRAIVENRVMSVSTSTTHTIGFRLVRFSPYRTVDDLKTQ